jgi:hypothetical protein
LRVAIIGAGSSGLAAAKNFQQEGFAAVVFEREADLGGNWHFASPAGRVYRSTHTISSKPGTEYPDFPMPGNYPDYPHHTQILEYLRAYARRFALEPLIRFRSEVTRVEPDREAEPGTGWTVSLADGTTEHFEALVVANGHHRSPRFPQYPGSFAGTTMHSADYKTPEVLAGKRVLVIGGGNSGCDIAVEAAQFGALAWHSTRRGYWYMPKYLLGRPADQVGDLMLALRIPLWLRRASASLLHRVLVGSPRRSRLPRPDHRLFETHPVINTLLPYFVAQGDIQPVADVARFDGPTVHFQDGHQADFDLIVFATGYDLAFPFIAERHLNWQENRPDLYLNLFHPHFDTLFVAGMIQPDSGQFGLVHWQTLAAARYARGALNGRPDPNLSQRKANPAEDLTGGVRYRKSPRHQIEVEHWSYARKVRGWARRLGSHRTLLQKR